MRTNSKGERQVTFTAYLDREPNHAPWCMVAHDGPCGAQLPASGF